ncbi:hypothetical protein HHK36_028798 [Tetracentron sinense]|uniref:Protein kinase domain-containing protein n=1 Tax=Tetracentron sinense TaxID=13715 RepID=A0A834YDZ6_TETSI|nr:hypothetical protein HHK36_028798 [Tetracentron sinense]
MGDNKGGETINKQHSSSPKDPLEELTEIRHQQQQSPAIAVTATPFISPSLYVHVPSGGSSSPFEQQQQQQQQQLQTVNPKRPRYGTGQWKLLPSPSPQQQVQQRQSLLAVLDSELTPSPTNIPQAQTQTTADSSSRTASSPSHSPLPSLSAASGQETSKPENEQFHNQLRKGKFVSPVWKPNEMLWLSRAWRVQYQGGADASGSSRSEQPSETPTYGGSGGGGDAVAITPVRGKTRAEKDKEVAAFLNRHGIRRDAKTAGTKWDNMLGEFRKVYEWERGDEREKVGKSYFRLSPYERKLHRLPASFDEEVFEELSQFMGSRMRSSQTRGTSAIVARDDCRTPLAALKALPPPPPPPPLNENELSLSGNNNIAEIENQLKSEYPILSFNFMNWVLLIIAARMKQVAVVAGNEVFFHGNRGSLFGLESSLDVAAPSSSSSSKEIRRIGKIRMTWEESVSIWAEEGEYQRGRVKLQGSSFLSADELTFLDEAMVACTMETFEDGPLRGFSVDKFVCGQQVKIFGRRTSSSTSSSGFNDRVQLPLTEPSIRSIPPWEYQDPSEYYVGCLRASPTTLPSLFELSWHLQVPPAEDLRFPLRKDVYRDLPQGKELFFTTSTELLDCRAFTYDILSPIIRTNPSISSSTATSRDSFIGIWDDCINRVVLKFCSLEMVLVRKPSNSPLSTISSSSSSSSSPSLTETLQDQWPNVTGFVRNFCLWRGEETDIVKEGNMDPSSSIVEKLLWTYMDLPYILGYYAIGYSVTFCALSRSQDRVLRTDLYSVDLSTPTERLKALVPCWRIACLLPLLADRCCFNNKKLFPYSDFERLDLGNGNMIEMTPNTVKRSFSSRRKWGAVKEIYDFLERRIPHAEYIIRASEKELALIFKPRGCKTQPSSIEEVVEALKYVTKALVALHDVSFMHRDLGWDRVVMRRSGKEKEWFVGGFEMAVGAPQIYPHEGMVGPRQAPEMGRGLHGVKVDVWGVGQLVKTCGLAVPKVLRELQNRCLDHNPEHRPTAAECYHHLLQLQSSLPAAAGPS